MIFSVYKIKKPDLFIFYRAREKNSSSPRALLATTRSCSSSRAAAAYRLPRLSTGPLSTFVSVSDPAFPEIVVDEQRGRRAAAMGGEAGAAPMHWGCDAVAGGWRRWTWSRAEGPTRAGRGLEAVEAELNFCAAAGSCRSGLWISPRCPRSSFLRRRSSLLCWPLEVSALLPLDLFALLWRLPS